MLIRMRLFAAASGLALAGAGLAGANVAAAGSEYAVPADTPEPIRRAVESPARSDEDRARDGQRRPAEVLTLAGVEPGDHIVEFASLGQYYTEMLLAAVGDDGRVDMYDMPYTDSFAGDAGRAFDEAHANAAYHQVHYDEMELPSGVDAVFNVLFYHDLRPLEVDTAAFNERVYEALRPGGVYLVIDHKAEEGSGWRDADTLHRMEVSTIVEEVTAAGFELAVESDLLAHPEDPRTQNVFDDEIRGRTDRAVFVFRRPEQ